MSLKFIYGQASYDHDRAVLDQIKNDYDPNSKDFYFYLVPNHIKFKSEVNTLKYLNPYPQWNYAQIKVQILSFTRLAWFFMSHKMWKQPQQLTDSGINMLLYKIIQDKSKQGTDLKVFQAGANQPGFLSKLASQISEMETGQITPEDLAKGLNDKATDTWDPDLTRKMHDFTEIYQAFEDEAKDKYLGKADVLATLCRFIKSGKIDLSHYHFYLSGFSQFTAQENELVQLLILHSASVVIDLNLDPVVKRQLPYRLPQKPELFYKPSLLYQRMYFFAKDNGIKPIKNEALDKKGHLRVTPDLLHLDKFWATINRRHTQIPHEKLQNPKSIQVVQAPNRYSELAKVALMIRQMIAESPNHYRYSDFLIMTRHLDKFKNIIKPIFKAQQIPIFVDLQKSMATHPLVQLLEALFSIYDPGRQQDDNYQYVDVMNLLKTELLIPKIDKDHYMDLDTYRNDLSLTENWVLKTGFHGSKWTESDDWQAKDYHNTSDNKPVVDQELTKVINVIHQFIRKILPPFYKEIENAKTGTDAAKILYNFLDQNGVIDQLKAWQKRDADPDNKDANDLTAANEVGQVWKVFCQLLDNFVAILGDQPFHLNNFLSMLQAGFEGAQFSQIPSTLDQVMISESRIVQAKDYKVVFMIGSTDEVMPDKITNDTLFSDEDRQQISPELQTGQYLNDDSEKQMENEPFLNYLAFMSAKERVIFTYSLNNEDDANKKVQVSPYVKRIADHFDITPIRVPLTATASEKATDFSNADRVINFVGTPKVTLRHLVQAACDANDDQESKEYQPMDKDWYYLYTQLDDDPMTNRLLGSLAYNNQPDSLKPDIVNKLYGNNINTSISQLEQFYIDPYEYFLKYGLQLKERDVFQLTPIEIGLFYHKIMEKFVDVINRNNNDFDLKRLTSEQIDSLVNGIALNILKDPNQPQYRVLTSSNRMTYIQHHLIAIIKRVIETMHQQSKFTEMRPSQAEIPFGVGKPLDVPRFKAGRHHINIEGRIDRIDALKIGESGFFSVVDYKSSEHYFDYGPIYYGDEMQMMTYLDVLYYNLEHHNTRILKSLDQGALAGVLYDWIHEPKVKGKYAKDDVDHGIMDDMKFHNALLVDDPTLLSHLDPKLMPSHNSIVYPIRRNKNSFSKKSLVSPDDLKMILQHTKDLIVDAGRKIYQGDIKIYPMRYNKHSKLDYSPYTSIMQFDPLLSMDRYHQIPKMSLKDLVKRLKVDKDNGQL